VLGGSRHAKPDCTYREVWASKVSDLKMSTSRKIKTEFIWVLLLCSSIVGCKPEVSTTLYAGDVLEVINGESELSVPIQMKLPIMSADQCEDDKSKMMPPLQRYGNNVRFVQCETVSGEMHDFLVTKMDAHIVQKDLYKEDQSFGMFGIVVSKDSNDDITIEFVTTKFTEDAVAAIDKQYVMQSVTLDDISLMVTFNNDTRSPVFFEIDGSFVNGQPIDAPTRFKLSRREEIEVIPSNVRSRSIVSKGIGRFGRLIKE